MSFCIGKFKKKKTSTFSTDVQTIKIDELPIDILYSSSEKKILQYVNSVNEILEQLSSHEISQNTNIPKINIPRLVVTGTQSSGKSTIINKFIGMNILPTGENMVTRTPVNIRLNTVESMDDRISCIYIYVNGNKHIIYSTETERINLNEFQNKIIEATNRLTDNSYSVSNSQIFIDINSPYVDTMTIIDLPGIVSIPCTDKGQPVTIVEDIRNLIIEQLEYPETYVLAVVSSLVDLEADSGLAIIKSVQRTNDKLKAVGVLTKSDGLKTYTKLNKIINNDENMSKDLMLNDGYFVVNNLVSDNSDWYVKTFGASSIIKRKRYGILNLKSHLKKVLMKIIKEKMSNIQNNLQLLHRDLINKTPKLDDNLEHTIAKLLFINNMMYIMSKGITESVNSIGIWRNVGNNIKDTFDTFVKDTNELDPFSASTFTDTELGNIISNFNGYIPNANDTTFLVVNRCLTDEHRQPIKLILPHAEKCISSLVKIIIHLVDELLRLDKLDIYPLYLNKYNLSLNNFPKLRNFILENTIDLLNVYTYKTTCNINHLLSIHERHLVWYDQKDFDEYYSQYHANDNSSSLENIIVMTDDIEKSNGTIKLKHDPELVNARNPTVLRMRILLKICFNKIIKTCQDEIYKTIASDIVKEFEHHFFIELNKKFIQMTEDKLNELFYETTDIVKQKKIYENMTTKIEQLLKLHDELN